MGLLDFIKGSALGKAISATQRAVNPIEDLIKQQIQRQYVQPTQQVLNTVRNIPTPQQVIQQRVVNPIKQYVQPQVNVRPIDVLREIPNTINSGLQFQNKTLGNFVKKSYNDLVNQDTSKLPADIQRNPALARGVAGFKGSYFGTGGSNLIGSEAKNIAKSTVKEDIMNILSKAKDKFGIKTNDISALSDNLVKTKTPQEVTQVINDFKSGVSGKVNPLIEEAKKYKSAEEFNKSLIYHGTRADLENKILSEGLKGSAGRIGKYKGNSIKYVSFAENPDKALGFAMGRGVDGTVLATKRPDKLLELGDIRTSGKQTPEGEAFIKQFGKQELNWGSPEARKYIKSKGYDSIRFINPDGFPEIRFFGDVKNIIKLPEGFVKRPSGSNKYWSIDESKLTDIYNQAHSTPPIEPPKVEQQLQNILDKNANNFNEGMGSNNRSNIVKLTPEEIKLRDEFFNYTSKPEVIAKYDAGAKDSEIIKDFINSKNGQPPTPPTPPMGTAVPEGKPKKGLLNLNNYNISDTAKGRINKVIEEVKPHIEKSIGTKLTNKEAVELAQNTSKTLNQVAGREQTKQWEAAMLKTRQQLAKSAKSNRIDKEFIDTLKSVKTIQTDIARKLQSLGISADPLGKTSKQAIMESIMATGAKTDNILTAAKGVDFNDAKQATDFYRKFVKPTTGEWLDLIRYNSMLSSPLTHIKNISTNALQVGLVKPIEKTLTGFTDIFSKNRTSFAGEGGAYVKGTLGNLGKATQKFADVMSGKSAFGNLDVKYIPINNGKLVNTLSFPTRMLEGMDQFFTTLATGGEQATLNLKKAKGIKIGNMPTAEEKAAYTVFRDKLGNTQQGYLLDSLDKITGQVEELRNNENPIIKYVSKFTLPFVKTPMNIFKQGLEYSPAGFATTIGAKNVTEQVSKALIGSAVFGGAATLLGSGRLTWGEPINEKQRNEFRAAGMQPYAVKIGDKWVAYKYLGPLAFPLAMVASIDYEQKQGRLDDTTTERIMGAVARYGEFLADQSYAKSMGDLLKAIGGGESSIAQLASNYPQQLIPFRALGGWLARITDPNQRKISKDSNFIEKQTQLLMQNIPFASQKLETRPDTFGNPIPNQNRVFNAFSPLSVTTENPLGMDIYQSSENKRAENRQIADLKKGQGGTTNTGKTVKKIGDEWKTFDTPEEADLAVQKQNFKNSDSSFKVIGDIVYRKNVDGNVTTQSKISYDAEYMEANKTRLKKNDNIKGWLDNASKLYDNYQQQLQDPTLDDLEKLKLQGKIDDLQAEAAKYQGYGGFTKPKAAKKAKKIKIKKMTMPKMAKSTLKISSPKLTSVRIKSPSLRIRNVTGKKPGRFKFA